MHGARILARAIAATAIRDEYGNTWQYHSRSDRHSKAACWGILFDLLATCPLLVQHAKDGKIAFGINHDMRDFRHNRKKKLDLVLCTPHSDEPRRSRGRLTLHSFAEKYEIPLDEDQRATLDRLPDLHEAPVGSVHVALEAKACMTAHVKALPRLYDELNSSHETIHGATDMAIAVGLAIVNMAGEFRSPDRNRFDGSKSPPNLSRHSQPADTLRTLEKLEEIPRRSKTGDVGFDAIAAVVLDARNDGGAVNLIERPPAPQPGEIFQYETMIRRVAHFYEARFRQV